MDPLAELIGASPAIQAVRDTVTRLLARQADARRLPPLLIQGETGTGKGLLARTIHTAGPRRSGPFIDVNCAAIPETLLEAELFGFERGAFTDARQAKPGLFQAAHHGTLFLDEIGLLPEALQSKLLTVIEERAVRRLGSTRSEPVDIWIVTASNEDLATFTRRGRFREDLYHRLAVLTVSLPPLRERGEDILTLAEHFLARACGDYGLPPRTLTPDARAALTRYAWPGNIRELTNAMERVALLGEATAVTAVMLALPELAAAEPRSRGRAAEPPPDDEDVLTRLTREREQLLETLRKTDWNISRAAAQLGLPRNTLRYRMEKHGLRLDVATPSRPRSPRAPSPATAPVSPPPAAPAAGLPRPAPAGIRWEPRRLTLLRAVLLPPGTLEAPPDTPRALEALVEKAQSFGGRIEELGRTGIIASFGLEPGEDAVRRAAHAALAMQKTSERVRRLAPERPAVRVGLHVGQFPVGQMGGVAAIDPDAKREAWAVVEALAAQAEADGILVSASAATLLQRRFELAAAGAVGTPPAPAYRLAGLAWPGSGRRLSRFVGRQDELDLLRSRLAAARRRHGQVVGIGGESGIGKSRLLAEFRARVADEPVTYLEGHCFSYRSATPYLPLIEIVRQTCGISEQDGPDATADRVRTALAAVGLDPHAAAPYLLHLLGLTDGSEPPVGGLSPEAVQTRTFEVMRQLSLRASRDQPLILAIEDLHWIDTASLAYLDALVDSLAGAPVLLLVTYRPGSQPRWLEKSYATQIALLPLSADESLSVLGSVLTTGSVPADDLAKRIVDKADGNPFFLEELARTLEQHGPAATATVPDTIQEVIEARIDRLPDEPRRILQTAAILGREVSLRVLREVADGAADPTPHLRVLTRLEFLYDKPVSDEPVYVFTHALTREVARETLPTASRQALHAAAGRALERLHADRLEEVADRLAYHWSKAKQADKAIEFLTRLADKAARSYAHVEAAAALGEALEHAARLPDDTRSRLRVDLVLRQAHSLSFLGRFPETLDLLARERGELDRLGSPDLAGPFHFWLAHTQSYLGDHAQAVASAGRALEEAEQAGDEATTGKANVVLAQEHYWSGQPVRGIARGSRAAALLEAGDRWWLGLAHWIVGINYVIIGAFEAALAAENRALAVGEALGDPRIQSYATWSTGWIHALTGAWEAGIEACRRALGTSPDPVNTAVALGHLGYVHLEKGDADQAIPLLEQAVAHIRQFGFRRLEGRFTTFLGEAYLLAGRLDEARERVGEGLRITSEVGYWYGFGWAQHALGSVARAGRDFAEAERQLAAAQETFARIQARFMLGRTELALAEVAEARGDASMAARRLQDAYAIFRVLGVTSYVERAVGVAARLGVSLADAAIQPRVAIVRRGEDELFRTLGDHLAALNLSRVIWDRRSDATPGGQPAENRRGPSPPSWDSLGFLLTP